MYMTKFWFKNKHYGYGFYPITWQGWLATLIFIFLIFLSAYTNGFFSENTVTTSAIGFLLDIIILSALFTILFKDSVKGGLRWKWGEDITENSDSEDFSSYE